MKTINNNIKELNVFSNNHIKCYLEHETPNRKHEMTDQIVPLINKRKAKQKRYPREKKNVVILIRK